MNRVKSGGLDVRTFVARRLGRSYWDVARRAAGWLRWRTMIGVSRVLQGNTWAFG